MYSHTNYNYFSTRFRAVLALFFMDVCMYIVSLEFIKRYPLEQHEQNDIIQWIKYKDFNIKKKCDKNYVSDQKRVMNLGN